MLQKAFHKTGASQCGYCIPGMVMAATAAIRANPFVGPRGDQGAARRQYLPLHRLSEDLRRGRAGARRAERPRCRRPRSPKTRAEDGRFIGANVRRIDAPSKVSGALKYAGDMVMPGMLHMQVLRSPHPHARIVSIDTSRAEAMAGRRGRHHLRRRAGRGRLRRVRARPAGHGARQGALCRRSGRGGRRRGRGHRPARAVPRSRSCTSRCRRCSIPKRRCGRARRCCTTMRRTTSPSTFRSASATSSRALPNPTWSSSRPTPRSRSSTPISSRKPGLAYVDHDGVVTIVSPSQNITHHRHMLAKHHRQADQQGALHHVAGRRRLRRQGRHDLSRACWR